VPCCKCLAILEIPFDRRAVVSPESDSLYSRRPGKDGMVSGTFQVAVAKESAGFSAAHFLTLPGHMCERLHGHNYRVAVQVEGAIDPATGFLLDFAVLKQALKALIEPMDHRLLIPASNPALTVREDGPRLALDYTSRDWMVVPTAHACLVPVRHTTAELLAEYLGRAVWDRLTAGGAVLAALALQVEESAGQTATWRTEATT
jgi:6-pyruvoyltetrahydropterin/6-carboxytetrahydropterin synthase